MFVGFVVTLCRRRKKHKTRCNMMCFCVLLLVLCAVAFSFFPCLLSANPFLCFILAFTFFFSQVILLFCILSTPRFVLEILLSRTSSLFPFLLHFVLLSDGAAVSYRNTWYLHFLPNPTKPNCANQSKSVHFFAIQNHPWVLSYLVIFLGWLLGGKDFVDVTLA